MVEQGDQQVEVSNGDEISAGYRAAVLVTVVAGVLAVLVAGLLLINHYQLRVYDPLNSVEFAELKAELAKSPNDEALKVEIRELDQKLRQEFFSRQGKNATGVLLAVGAVAVMLWAMKMAAREKSLPPMPGGERPGGDEASKVLRISRGAVVVVAVLAGVGAVGLSVFSQGGGQYRDLLASLEANGGGGEEAVAEVEVMSPYPTREEVYDNWPWFRGPGGDGVAVTKVGPLAWDGKAGVNVLWKSAVAIEGDSSAVVWGDRVFVTGAKGNRREVYCYDAESGVTVWQRRLDGVEGSPEEDPELLSDSIYAAATAATDGRRVYAIFANGDLGAFDYEGKRLWDFAFGMPINNYGHATSLTMWEKLLIVQFDQGYADEGMSAIIAFDGETGEIVWDVDREVGASWTTPVIVKVLGREQLITLAEPYAIGYDPTTGEELWRSESVAGEIACSPVVCGDVLIIVSPDEGVTAVKLSESEGEIKAEVIWTNGEIIPDVASPVCDGERVYLLTSDGTLGVLSVEDGGKVWQHDYDEFMFQSSPTLMDGKVYITATDGTTVILTAGDEYQELGRCELGEQVHSSPAFVGNRMYLRAKDHLYCIMEDGP